MTKTNWAMPQAPEPNAIAAYYNDDGNIFLGWFNQAQEPVGGTDHDIDWPFEHALTLNTELEAIGFIELEAI